MDTNEQFNKYLSSGFAEINDNEKSMRFMAGLYEHNYGKFLPKDLSAPILDFGCGAGQCLNWLTRRGYKNVLGVDVGSEAVDFCRKKGLPAQKVADSLSWLEKNSGKYLVIFANDVIEHITKPDIIPMMSALFKALKPGGVMIIKTNNVSAITGARMRYWDYTHSTSFTEYSLKQVLFYAGVKDVDLFAFKFPLDTFSRIIRLLLQFILHTVWKLCFWIEYTIAPKIVHEYIFAVARKD